MWLKMSRRTHSTLIDLCDLGLDTIEEDEQEFRIGAMVTLRQMETHPGLDAYSCGAVRDAFKDIVGVQFRNGATLGGSLWRRMGFSDILTVFMAMDSYVELHKGGLVALEDFARMQPDRDVIVRLIVKKTPGAFAYQAVRKQRTDLPSLNCAAGKVGDEWRVVVGARPARAALLRDERGILADGMGQESAARFGEYAAEVLSVGSNMWGSAAYRRALIPAVVRRALIAAGERL